MTTREPGQQQGAAPPDEENVIPFERRRPPRTSTVPEPLLHRTEATLRAADVYSRLLIDRLETARRAGGRDRLGALDGAALLHVAVIGEALERALDEALAQVDRELARSAHLIAEAASEVVPGGGGPG